LPPAEHRELIKNTFHSFLEIVIGDTGQTIAATMSKLCIFIDHPHKIHSFSPPLEHGELILLQLPDTLPGEPPEPATPREKGDKHAPKPAAGQGGLDLSSLRDFSEGIVGTLQVRKSGRTQLVLGNGALDVNMGTPTGFLQVNIV
jgi:hypothetical protein